MKSKRIVSALNTIRMSDESYDAVFCAILEQAGRPPRKRSGWKWAVAAAAAVAVIVAAIVLVPLLPGGRQAPAPEAMPPGSVQEEQAAGGPDDGSEGPGSSYYWLNAGIAPDADVETADRAPLLKGMPVDYTDAEVAEIRARLREAGWAGFDVYRNESIGEYPEFGEFVDHVDLLFYFDVTPEGDVAEKCRRFIADSGIAGLLVGKGVTLTAEPVYTYDDGAVYAGVVDGCETATFLKLDFHGGDSGLQAYAYETVGEARILPLTETIDDAYYLLEVNGLAGRQIVVTGAELVYRYGLPWYELTYTVDGAEPERYGPSTDAWAPAVKRSDLAFDTELLQAYDLAFTGSMD